MKKTILVMILVLAFAVTGSAQMKMTASLGGSYSMPTSLFGDIYDGAIGFNGGFGFKVSPSFEVGINAGYLTFPGNDLLDAASVFLGIDPDDMDWTIIEILGDVKFMIPMGESDMAFHPYIAAGGGITMHSLKGGGDTESKFGFNGGAGFEYLFSPTMGAFVEGRYMLAAEDVKYLQFKAGIKFLFGGSGE